MKKDKFYLSALMDVPDDMGGGKGPMNAESIDAMIKELAANNVKRLYYQWYGDARDGWLWDCHLPTPSNKECGRIYRKTAAQNMGNFNKCIIDAAHRYGMEVVGILRTQESGHGNTYSEFYPEVREFGESCGVPAIDGYIMNPNRYLAAHPESRIKRRTFDIDEEAEKTNISVIEIRKQNDRKTRIRKDHLKIYVSDNNSYFTEYTGDFNFEITKAIVEEDVVVAIDTAGNCYKRRTLTKKGETVTAIRLSGLDISEKYVAITCSCGAAYDGEDMDARFSNTLMAALRCYNAEGKQIPISVGNDIRMWPEPEGRNWRECGLGYDAGWGEYFLCTLDPDNGEGLYGLCRGKNRYVPADLCECDEGVQQYWFEMLDRMIEDGVDMVSHRVENHSLMMDDCFAYGYNDSIKEKYWAIYGKCEEREMDLKKISKIRGDVFTELFIEGAKRARAAGKKVVLQLNAEMLYDPIPLERRFAYPMNVEWQWERWLEEIKPDEITFRTYLFSPRFVLQDPQCLNLIHKARTTGVPMAYERYVDLGRDFVQECRMIRDSGLFDSIIMYETWRILQFDGKGGIYPNADRPNFLDRLKEL